MQSYQSKRIQSNRIQAQPTTPLAWLRSSRNLDFCLLAFCSCILALLCHQTVVISGQTTTASATRAPATVQFSQIDWLIKSGLFAKSQESDESSDETDPA
jgi:hypothetical protein